MLQWLVANDKAYVSALESVCASQGGHLHILQYLVDIGHPLENSDYMVKQSLCASSKSK